MQYEAVERALKASVAKTSRSATRTMVLSVMAGAFIALGGCLSLYLGSGVPGVSAANPAIGKLLSALSFPVGLFLIVMFGGELFTGNNAVLIPGVAHGNVSPSRMVTNWAMVWTGNFIGALLFTYLLVIQAGLVDSAPYSTAIRNIAVAKASLPLHQIFLRGVGANWCVCLAVWLTLGLSTFGQKTFAIWIPIAAFVALGFEHCIANMFFIPCGMWAGADITVWQLLRNLTMSTFGNIVGGALLVGMLYTKLYRRR